MAGTALTALLVSPHIDRVSDHGYLRVSPGQRQFVVPEVRDRSVDAWGIQTDVDVGPFTRGQSAYLDYHRARVFCRHPLDVSRP